MEDAMPSKPFISLGIALFLCCLAVEAQTFTGTITGTVFDPGGAVIPGATVAVTDTHTGLSRSAVTDGEGNYLVPLLQPSLYQVSAEQPGFQKMTQEGVRLEVNQTAEVNLTLALAGSSATVVVSAGASALLNTEQSSIDQTIEQKFIEDLPLVDQNIFQFVQIAPGVVSANPGNPAPIGDIGNRNFFDSNFSINGGKGSTNDVLLDGVANVIGDFNGVGTVPPVSSVQEFKVQSGAYSAEFGRSGGGNINIVTKSGGKKLHGTLFEYLQNSELNANGWQRNRVPATARRISNRRNHFGGSLSGPLRIPRLLTGNSTFFYFDYEGRRNRDPYSGFFTVPTARQKQGDFSETRNFQGNPITIYNPWTTRVDPAAPARYLRDPFPNNRIDCQAVNPATGKRFCDPVALAAIRYYPEPNLPGDISGLNNFIASGNNRLDKNLYSIRIDHTLSQQQNVFFRYTTERRTDEQVNPFQNAASSGRIIRDKFTNAALNHVLTFRTGWINNFRLGYTRSHANQIPFGTGFDPTDLGLPSYLRENAAVLQFPTFGVSGNIAFSALGSRGYNNQPRDTITVADSVVRVRGRHTIKPGFEYRLIRFFPFQVFDTTGNYSFGSNYTQGPNPDIGSNSAGLGFASFLLGAGTSATYEYGTAVTIYHHYLAGYLQDDWRISRSLTLNLGVRWDLETGTAESHGRLTTFDFGAPSPLAGKVAGYADLRGLLRFTEPGEAEWQADRRRLAPRVGLAYRWGQKMTVRAGYGLFFLPASVENLGSVGFNYTVSSTQPDPRIPQTLLNNPFPTGIPAIIGKSQGASSLLGQSLTAVPGRIDSSYNQLWNLALQRQIGKDWLAEAAYVGSRGVHLPMNNYNLNQLPLRTQALGNTALNQRISNPFYGWITDKLSTLSQTTVVRSQLLKPYPQYISLNLSRPLANWGVSSYHSLQLKLQKRFSGGVSLLTHYTWSKSLDTGGTGSGIAFYDATPVQDLYNLRDQRSLSTQDVPRRAVFSGTFELPFGKGKRFGAGWAPLLQGLLGGWQANGVLTWQSGTPLSITSTNRLAIGNAVARASQASGINPAYGRKTARDNVRAGGNWFDTAAFYNPNDVLPAPPPGEDISKQYILGNTARTLGYVRRDSYRNLDFSLFKSFRITEQIRFQFRAESFNLLNGVVFGTPDTNTNSSQFGKIITQLNQPRKIQFSARITF